MFPFAKLTDGIVTIRPYEFGEEQALYTAIQESLPELYPWMSWATERYTLNVARDFIAITRAEWSRGTLYTFAITDSNTGEFLGGSGLSHFHPVYKFATSATGYAVPNAEEATPYVQQSWRLSSLLNEQMPSVRKSSLQPRMKPVNGWQKKLEHIMKAFCLTE